MARNRDRQISRQDWLDFAEAFSEDNEGRPVSIEIVGPVLGDSPLVEEMPLMGLDYDNKGPAPDTMLVSVEHDGAAMTHTMDNPESVWLRADSGGRALALEITGGDDRKLILTFDDV